MCLPPVNSDSNQYFKILKENAEKLNLKELSMGMSGDYQNAILTGSTYVRLGTLILGERILFPIIFHFVFESRMQKTLDRESLEQRLAYVCDQFLQYQTTPLPFQPKHRALTESKAIAPGPQCPPSPLRHSMVQPPNDGLTLAHAD